MRFSGCEILLEGAMDGARGRWKTMASFTGACGPAYGLLYGLQFGEDGEDGADGATGANRACVLPASVDRFLGIGRPFCRSTVFVETVDRLQLLLEFQLKASSNGVHFYK